jgi:hypothetical protein
MVVFFVLQFVTVREEAVTAVLLVMGEAEEVPTCSPSVSPWLAAPPLPMIERRSARIWPVGRGKRTEVKWSRKKALLATRMHEFIDAGPPLNHCIPWLPLPRASASSPSGSHADGRPPHWEPTLRLRPDSLCWCSFILPVPSMWRQGARCCREPAGEGVVGEVVAVGRGRRGALCRWGAGGGR